MEAMVQITLYDPEFGLINFWAMEHNSNGNWIIERNVDPRRKDLCTSSLWIVISKKKAIEILDTIREAFPALNVPHTLPIHGRWCPWEETGEG